MFAAAFVNPHNKIVIPVCPELINRQDGCNKNDCERNVAKRLLFKLREEHLYMKIFVVENGLSNNVPHIRDLKELDFRFILGANPGDHVRLFDTVKQRGATPLLVYRDKQPLGFLSVSDQVRGSAARAVTKLRKLGLVEIGILSGDHQRSVDLVGREVGIYRLWAGLKPGDKLKRIQEEQRGGARVVFVGDGINDAPALAAADTGIAMGARGTDVALETADIALMGDDIGKLPFLITLGRRMLLIIKFNIAFGLFFNLIAVLAGAGGLLTPIMGALVHNIGSVLVVLLSASIGFIRENEGPL